MLVFMPVSRQLDVAKVINSDFNSTML
jgi:hypothetical protein